MEAEESKTVLRRIVDEVINGRDLDAADELFAADHVLHPETTGVGRGPEGMRAAFAGLHEEFPDVQVELAAIVAEDDVVAVRLTFRGTHAVTGERAVWPEAIFTRVVDGRAAESWELIDTGRARDSPPW